MFIFSTGSGKLKKAAVTAGFAVLLAAVCSLVTCAHIEPIKSTATADEIGSYSTSAENGGDIARFLSVFGIEADPGSEEADSVRIPPEFNETYTKYNKLQTEIGLDLSPFKGENVKRLTYKLKNKGKQVTLLVFKKHIIGGHICSGIYGEGYESLISEKYGQTG